MLVADHHFDTAFLGSEWSDIPNSQRVVHRVGQDKGAIRAQCQSGNCVSVSFHSVQDGVLTQVPHLVGEIVVCSLNKMRVDCVVENWIP